MEDILFQNYEILLNCSLEQLNKIKEEKENEGHKKVIEPLINIKDTKTYIENFDILCREFDIDSSLMINFFKDEFSCDVISNKKILTIKMKCDEKKFNSVYRKFIIKYIICKYCNSKNTILNKDKNTRLLLLNCKQCFSKYIP